MHIDIAEIESRLELLTWRDREFAAVTEALEQAFPALLISISERVAALGPLQLARALADARALTKDIVEPWAAEQSQRAITQAETHLSTLIGEMRADGQLQALQAALPAAVGAGMLAASVLALPSLVTYATVTTTSMLFFTTSAISVPTLLVGGGALAVLSLSGSTLIGKAGQMARDRLTARVEILARAAVFGTGQPPSARSLVTDLQTAVIAAGQKRLLEVL